MSTRQRLLVALASTLLLVGLAWVCPVDGGNRGPALLSILGKWHLLALHLPAALLFALPALEWLHPSDEPSRPVRTLADIAAAGTWLATALGILHGHFNGFEGEDVERHLQLGVFAAAVSSLAWALMGLRRPRRIALQCLAALGVALAAHIGGEMVHGEGFLTEPSKADGSTSLASPVSHGFSLFPSAQAAEYDNRAGYAPNAENGKLAAELGREFPVRSYLRSNASDWGINVHILTDEHAPTFGDVELARLSKRAGPEVAWLQLDRTRITDQSAGNLARFTRLMALSVGDTQVGDPTAEAIARLPNVRLVTLSGTRITDKGLAALATSPNLNEVYLDNTSCTPEAIAAFCKARPSAIVIRNGKFYGKVAPAPK